MGFHASICHLPLEKGKVYLMNHQSYLIDQLLYILIFCMNRTREQRF